MNAAMAGRLRFIEFLLAQYGHVNRSAIEDYFGLSTPQASADLKLYAAHAPGNMHYSASMRRYETTPAFKRYFP